jgi:hypothetical protein
MTGKDLVALALVSRFLHSVAVPAIYQHTVLKLENRPCPTNREGVVQPWMATLHGLAVNSQHQCRHVRKLTVRSDGPLGAYRPPLPSFSHSGIHGSRRHINVYEEYDQMTSGLDPFRYLVNSLLEVAIRQMSHLNVLK